MFPPNAHLKGRHCLSWLGVDLSPVWHFSDTSEGVTGQLTLRVVCKNTDYFGKNKRFPKKYANSPVSCSDAEGKYHSHIMSYTAKTFDV